LPGFSGLIFSGTRRPGISGPVVSGWDFPAVAFLAWEIKKNSMGSRQIFLVSTAGISVLNAGIFWREAKTKRLFSQCGAVVEYWAADPKDVGSPPACAL
jgi:hypothetical protein